MADLTDIQSSKTVKIVGADATGDEMTPVRSTSSGRLETESAVLGKTEDGDLVNIAVDSEGKLLTSGISEILSPLPSLRIYETRVLPAQTVFYKNVVITEKTAIKEFHIGGRASGEATLAKYYPLNQLFAPGGGFNSSGDVAMWTNTGNGSSASIIYSYTSSQFVEGTGSVTATFTQSDANNFPQITYTFPTPIDLSRWKKISAHVRVTVATGGSQTRTVSIRLQSGTAIRIWQITGTTTTAPFNVLQWHNIIGDLEDPHAVAGSGVFDINNVNSISLRLQDSGNKSGTIWWDNVRFLEELEIVDKIYTSGGTTTQLSFDPVLVFNTGENLMLIMRNNSASAAEFQAAASGVDIS